MNEDSLGFAFGRFQPFHIGHVEYLSKAINNCDILLIGITNPDPGLTKFHPDSIHRSLLSSNPFTYYERSLMIRDSLIQEGYDRDQFEITPFPINFPEKFKYYIPEVATVYLSICEKWGYTKLKMFQNLNYSIKILFEKNKTEKLTSGVEIRNSIAKDLSWEHLVPPAVKKLIASNHLEDRIKDIIKAEQGVTAEQLPNPNF